MPRRVSSRGISLHESRLSNRPSQIHWTIVGWLPLNKAHDNPLLDTATHRCPSAFQIPLKSLVTPGTYHSYFPYHLQ